MADAKPLISIIVPVYNTKQYLCRCVDSIINQTYRNTEVLLIDDGSTDGSSEICDKYAIDDYRVVTIHKENTGQSDSQNIGLQKAKGEFIAFVDSDDFMLPNMLEVLMQKINAYDADIGVCSYIRTAEPDFDAVLGDDIILSGLEAMGDIFTSGGKINPETWAKVYRTSLFLDNDVFFPKGLTAGDQHTTYRLMFYAKKIIRTMQPLFCYTFRSDSITGVSFSKERLNVLGAGKAAISFVKEKQISLENHAMCFYIGLNLYLINQILKDSNGYIWSGVLYDLRKTILSCCSWDAIRLLPKRRRIGIQLLCMGWWAYKPARKIYMMARKQRLLQWIK